MKTQKNADIAFALKTAVLILFTHAIAYFAHEFSHSVTAWMLGYMANPLMIDYGTLSPGNLIMLFEIGDNVQYSPMLKSGNGVAAAAIALAGPFIGNGLLYASIYRVMKFQRTRGPVVVSFSFWMLTMCAGNIWSYVPIRSITTHADIAIAASGLDIGVLALFPILLIPSLFIAYHFFTKVCLQFIPAIAHGNMSRAGMVIALTTVWFFFLYGGVGLFGNYGAVSQAFSLCSAFLLMPLSLVWLWQRITNGSVPYGIGNGTRQ